MTTATQLEFDLTVFAEALPVRELLDGEASRQTNRLLEMAYMRLCMAQAAGDEALAWFQVTKQRPAYDLTPDRVHPAKVMADRLLLHGLLARHPRRHMFRLAEAGIAHVEQHLSAWRRNLSAGQAEALAKFEALMPDLWRERGLLPLPEPGRSWRSAIAFDTAHGWPRKLYVYRSFGYHAGMQWDEGGPYYYGDEPEFVFESEQRAIEQMMAEFP